MAVRLVVTFHATPGKGAELTQAMKARCEISRQDAGCEQFEVFQSVFDPDKLVLLELWKDQPRLTRTPNCRRSARLCRRGYGSALASARTIPTTVPAECGRRQNAGLVFRNRPLLRALEPAAGMADAARRLRSRGGLVVDRRRGALTDHCLSGALGVLAQCESSSGVHRLLLLRDDGHTRSSRAHSPLDCVI
jgi:hypothetical protein